MRERKIEWMQWLVRLFLRCIFPFFYLLLWRCCVYSRYTVITNVPYSIGARRNWKSMLVCCNRLEHVTQCCHLVDIRPKHCHAIEFKWWFCTKIPFSLQISWYELKSRHSELFERRTVYVSFYWIHVLLQLSVDDAFCVDLMHKMRCEQQINQ